MGLRRNAFTCDWVGQVTLRSSAMGFLWRVPYRPTKFLTVHDAHHNGLSQWKKYAVQIKSTPEADRLCCTNMLIRRFGKCSMDVKRVLFRSYCLCLYDTGLWKFYKTTVINKLKSAYNRCMKMFFGYSRYQMLLDLALPSFETLITNSRFTFMKMYNGCSNQLVAYLRVLDI